MSKSLAWRGLSAISAMVAATAVRRLTVALWPGSRTPPLNPADRRIDWTQALLWAGVSGLGAGLSRLLAQRVAAAGWSKALDETPPGVAAS